MDRPPLRCLLFAFVAGLTMLAPTVSGYAQDASPIAAPEVPDPALCRVAPRPLADFRKLAQVPTAEASAATPAPFVPPVGTPADQVTVAAITGTMRELIACFNAGDPARAYALFTDGALQRQVARGGLAPAAMAELAATPTPLAVAARLTLVAVGNVTTLSEVRAGAFVTTTDPAAGGTATEYAVFAKVGDRWLIDDLVAVGTATPTP